MQITFGLSREPGFIYIKMYLITLRNREVLLECYTVSETMKFGNRSSSYIKKTHGIYILYEVEFVDNIAQTNNFNFEITQQVPRI
jgi:hypothetical protein